MTYLPDTGYTPLEPLPPLLLFREELVFPLLLLPPQFFFRPHDAHLGLAHVFRRRPFRVRAALAAHDVVAVRRASAAVGTEAGEVERAEGRVLDVPERAVGAERAEAAGVVWAGGVAEA